MNSPLMALRPLEIPGFATFEDGKGGLPRLAVSTPLAEAHIYLHGAHITHFQPRGLAPVLFMSAKSLFASGQPIRGGIPIIFPWFGVRAGFPHAPAHGFARTQEWQIESLSLAADQVVNASFRFDATEASRTAWPHDFTLRFHAAIGRTLSITLEVENTGPKPFAFENALHTYFAVSDVRETAITGLANAEYLDKTNHFTRKKQGSESIRITQETDRLYEHAEATCAIVDLGWKRRIVLEKDGSQTTVVWNPWITKAAAMPDFGDDEWPRMLCIETANVGNSAVTVFPGTTHTMRSSISSV